jgi:hypothetical protein
LNRHKHSSQRSSIAEVQEIEFRQARQLKPNLYLKVDDLRMAKFTMSSWNYSLIEKQKAEAQLPSACILAIHMLPAALFTFVLY